jgi:CRP/FNR family transcriptional regulator, cyclic AMP receptor protein
MTHWMCTTCGYYFQGPSPLDKCPGCNQACAFNDVTCYRPDCGGESNVDPLLVGGTLGTLTGTRAPQVKPSISHTPVESAPIAEIMGGLSEKQKQKVRNLGRVETYEQNSVICNEGDESRKLYLVEEGQVAVQSELGRGMRIPITIVSEGQVFGWSVLVPPHKLTATVTASSKTKVLAIEREPLLSLMQKDPSLGLTIMQNIASIVASRLRNLELEMVGMVQRVR